MRQAIAVCTHQNYYTAGRPASELRDPEHGHTTLFQARPGEVFTKPSQLARVLEDGRSRAFGAVRRVMPDALVSLVKQVMKRG